MSLLMDNLETIRSQLCHIEKSQFNSLEDVCDDVVITILKLTIEQTLDREEEKFAKRVIMEFRNKASKATRKTFRIVFLLRIKKQQAFVLTNSDIDDIVNIFQTEFSTLGTVTKRDARRFLTTTYGKSFDRFQKKSIFKGINRSSVKLLQDNIKKGLNAHFATNLSKRLKEILFRVQGSIAAKKLSKIQSGKQILFVLRDEYGLKGSTGKALKNLGKLKNPAYFSGSREVVASYFENYSSIIRSKASNFGRLNALRSSGITGYRLENPMDTRTSPVCAFMNGREFFVTDGVDLIERTLRAKDPSRVSPFSSISDLHSIAGKGYRHKQLSSTSNQNLMKGGVAMPPFHGRCRTVAVPI